MTPSPRIATASRHGAARKLSARPSSSQLATCGRSRLLYWKTMGIEAGSRPQSTRLAVISRTLATFSSTRSCAELATNTTASAPRTASRREAAYAAWPGTATSWKRISKPWKPTPRSGSRSNRIVRSWSEFTEMNSPRWRSWAASCSSWRFVVFPPTAGP